MATELPPTENTLPAQTEVLIPNPALLNQSQNTLITNNSIRNVFLQVNSQDQFKRVQFITESLNADGSVGSTNRFELYLSQAELSVLINKLQEHLTS